MSLRSYLDFLPGYLVCQVTKLSWTTLFLKKNLSFRTLFLRNDFISFWKLCSLSILSLLHCLQMFWTVSLQEFQYDIMFKKNGRSRVPRSMFDKAMNFVFLFLDRSSEYSAFWRCVKAGAAYLVTQLCKVKRKAKLFHTSF